MSKNISQIYTANPITSNAGTDLMYFGQSPYTTGDDAGMTFSNFSAQFAPSSAGFTWINAPSSQTMASGTGYIANSSGLISLALPSTIAVGGVLRIAAYGAGLFTITQSSGQQIIFCSQATTLGAGGSVSASKQFDCIELVCVSANNTFLALSSCGNLTIV